MNRLFSFPSKLFPVLCFFICLTMAYGAAPIPSVTGPIKVTADSYPFGSAAATAVPQDLSKFGYVEEEFFISGKANVYDFDSAGKVIVKTPDASYTSRVLIRRPAAASNFSGNVIVELLNPSLSYDWDPQWMFCRDYFIAHRDIWVGITVKPIAAKTLKRFNPERYAPLSWTNPLPLEKTCPKSALYSDTVPETENGLAWDIVSQVGALVKSSAKQNPLRAFKVKYVYATGYSQTGAFVTSYINFIRPLATAMLGNGKPIYDGYLIGDGEGYMQINQCSKPLPPGVAHLAIQPRNEPVISIVTQGMLGESIPVRRPDSDEAGDRYRRYEVPGASHGNVLVFNYAPGSAEMGRAGVQAIAPNCIGADKYGLTDFHLEFVMNAAFANLNAWVRSNIPPPRVQLIETTPSGNNSAPEIKLDQHGNAIGGFRTPYVDLPVATYYPRSKPADEKSGDYCFAQGYKVPFEKEKIRMLYPTREIYLNRVRSMVDSMVKERFLTEADGEKVKKEAEKVSGW